jgi:cytochrome P450
MATVASGPTGHWLWGNLTDLRHDMLGFLLRCAREYGDVVPMRFADRRALLLSHPKAIEYVLVTENRRFQKHFAVQLLRPLLGNGLLNNEGASWLSQRRLCQPAFHRERIEGYAASMVSLAEQLLREWRSQPQRDVHDDMMRLTLGIATKTLMDVDAGDEALTVSEAADVIMEDFTHRFQSAVRLPYWVPTARNRRVIAAIRQLDGLIRSMITSRRASRADHGDLLSTLIHIRDVDDGHAMTDRQLRDEIMTMFLAGHETTAVTLTWTWYLLGQHPAIEEKLRQQIVSVLNGRLPTSSDVPNLAYCEYVIREALRLYPPAYLIGRRALEPMEFGDLQIPSGINVLMSQWVVHHDERWFAEPDAFRPDRWAEPGISQLPKYAYFPFGGGPRSCIGNQFAMFEMVLILATLVPPFRIQLDSMKRIRPRPAVTLRPSETIQATMHARP